MATQIPPIRHITTCTTCTVAMWQRCARRTAQTLRAIRRRSSFIMPTVGADRATICSSCEIATTIRGKMRRARPDPRGACRRCFVDVELDTLVLNLHRHRKILDRHLHCFTPWLEDWSPHREASVATALASESLCGFDKPVDRDPSRSRSQRRHVQDPWPAIR